MFQMRLMKGMRESIKKQTFPEFVQNFMSKMYTDGQYPVWIKEALAAVNIHLKPKPQQDFEVPNKKQLTSAPCSSNSSS